MGGNNARKIGNRGRGAKNNKKNKPKSKKDPFQGSSFASGIVINKGYYLPISSYLRCFCPRDHENYGSKSCAVVRLVKAPKEKNQKHADINAFIPFDGGANYVDINVRYYLLESQG
jgi:hypothetical protein